MFTKTKHLNQGDLIAKYIFKQKELKEFGNPRPNILNPRAGEKLSLSEVTNLNHNKICEHGHKHADNLKINRIHIGYVKFKYESFKKLGLKAIYDNDPIRHVSVEFPNILPEQRRELAKALSDEAIVVNPISRKKYFAPCPIIPTEQ